MCSKLYLKPFLLRAPCIKFNVVASQAVREHLTHYDMLFAQDSRQDFLMMLTKVAISKSLLVFSSLNVTTEKMIILHVCVYGAFLLISS